MRNHVTRRYRSEYQGVCTMSHSICFPPRKVTAVYTVTKIASKKIRSSNHHHQQKQQKHHRSPIPKNALFFFCLSFLVRGFGARLLFVTLRERERKGASSILYNTFVGIHYSAFFFRSPKGRAFFKKKEKIYPSKASYGHTTK